MALRRAVTNLGSSLRAAGVQSRLLHATGSRAADMSVTKVETSGTAPRLPQELNGYEYDDAREQDPVGLKHCFK